MSYQFLFQVIVVFSCVVAGPAVAVAQELGLTRERATPMSSPEVSIQRDMIEDAQASHSTLIVAASPSAECRVRCEKAYGKCNNRPGGMKQCAEERRACYKKCK